MKLFTNLFKIISTKKDTYPGDTSGESLIATGEGSAEKGETAQVYGHHGFISNPPNGIKGIRIRIGSLDIIIGALSYKVPPPVNPGETKVYSTDGDGVEQGKHEIDTAGIHKINDGSLEAARNTDTTELIMSAIDIQLLAVNLLLTTAFVPSGIPPTPTSPAQTFTGGEITSGTSEVLLP